MREEEVTAAVNATLGALDRALEDSPDRIYEDLAEAVRRVAALRDRLIAERRRRDGGEGGGADRLARVNAVLSLVVGGEYPLEGVRRQRIERARRELADIFDAG